jgi:hypothetical protein
MIEPAIVGLSRAAVTGLLTMTPLVLVAIVGAWAWTLRRRGR